MRNLQGAKIRLNFNILLAFISFFSFPVLLFIIFDCIAHTCAQQTFMCTQTEAQLRNHRYVRARFFLIVVDSTFLTLTSRIHFVLYCNSHSCSLCSLSTAPSSCPLTPFGFSENKHPKMTYEQVCQSTQTLNRFLMSGLH